jgi:hypothetical protein
LGRLVCVCAQQLPASANKTMYAIGFLKRMTRSCDRFRGINLAPLLQKWMSV